MSKDRMLRFNDLTDEEIRRAVARSRRLRGEFIVASVRALGRRLTSRSKASSRAPAQSSTDTSSGPYTLPADPGVKLTPAGKPSAAGRAKEETYRWTA